jgi:hypothetical protein
MYKYTYAPYRDPIRSKEVSVSCAATTGVDESRRVNHQLGASREIFLVASDLHTIHVNQITEPVAEQL